MRWLGLVVITAALVAGAAPALAENDTKPAGPDRPLVRVITTAFVLPAKFEQMRSWATEAGVDFDAIYIESDAGDPAEWLADAALAILDTPRPGDRMRVEEALGGALEGTRSPWLRIGGGLPGARNLAPEHARMLGSYYVHGSEANYRRLFAYIARWHAGADVGDIAPAEPLPTTGFYHPDAPAPFSSLEDYLAWGAERWPEGAGRVALVISPSVISDLRTDVVDAIVKESEAAGLAPIAFWFQARDPNGLTEVVRPAGADVLINLTHMQNGEARKAEFVDLDIPVLQTTTYRDGTPAEWANDTSGSPARIAATFLAVPEAWGMSDPIVISAVEDGAAIPLMGQVRALVAKTSRLVSLQRKPAAEKRAALMFWNYPPGDKNVSASNLNVPRSLAALTAALADAGYEVTPTEEETLIRAGQTMLGAVYDPGRLDDLLADGLADTLPLRRYRTFWDDLPQARRDQLLAVRGSPDAHFALREIDGEPHFIIPRLQVGNLVILPQLPRSGRPHDHYHDVKELPDHFYLAAYLYVRDTFGADALIHFGTHGTQEWLPGKDRGLAVDDYPFLALGDLPVFYVYIQDNVAEALQAKRRGRAVTVSHQTPPFAPAGLYDELRNLHDLVHEYVQLEDGAVRDRTQVEIRDRVLNSNLHRDLGWDAEAIDGDFPGFFHALHDHLHELASHAMPLGLHTFGKPAAPEHRLSTVMQQLGMPFYERLDADPDEFFADDFAELQNSKPYRFLHRYLRADEAPADIDDEELRTFVERAAQLDRHLDQTGEIEALLNALAGRFVAPGPGGDPIRNPDVPSGRNLYGFEPDKIPTRAAYEVGGKALQQLIEAYRNEHDGRTPEKLAFSLWAGEAMRHLGVLESQVLHALGLRPVWDQGGRVTALEIMPAAELDRPRIDTVLQVTSVYRDQFDGFMRLLAEAIERLAALDEPDNPIAENSRAIAEKLLAQGQPIERARALGTLRLFSNEPGDYGSGLPDAVLKSTTWEDESTLAESFLARMQYAYGSRDWGARVEGGNLLADQLRGVQAAVLSRSSNLHGVLSTDHPFEYLGGLSLAIRHLDGQSPALYISDLRGSTSRVSTAARFLASEMRARYLNPHWISGMQQEGYAGTLQVLNFVNNLWGWQVTDPDVVRADQWQAVHDTFVRDLRDLDLDAWFEQHNPSAQAQLLERLVEAIRKGYWDAAEQTQREIAKRWQQLATVHGVEVGGRVTREFVAELAEGFGLVATSTIPTDASSEATAQQEPAAASAANEPVRGQVIEPVPSVAARAPDQWRLWLGLALLLGCVLAGAAVQLRANASLKA